MVRITTDGTCVPISALAQCVVAAQEGLRKLGLDGAIVGHVGDGNFHLLLMIDLDDAGCKEKAHQLIRELNEAAWRFGGTCTGEHGIGQGKREALAIEHGSSIDLMRQIKAAVDPNGILNPGKLI